MIVDGHDCCENEGGRALSSQRIQQDIASDDRIQAGELHT